MMVPERGAKVEGDSVLVFGITISLVLRLWYSVQVFFLLVTKVISTSHDDDGNDEDDNNVY